MAIRYSDLMSANGEKADSSQPGTVRPNQLEPGREAS